MARIKKTHACQQVCVNEVESDSCNVSTYLHTEMKDKSMLLRVAKMEQSDHQQLSDRARILSNRYGHPT